MTRIQTKPDTSKTRQCVVKPSLRQLGVLHSLSGPWLEPTQTWLHEQVRNLPEDIESHIVCTDIMNLDQFPTRNVHAESDASMIRRAWDRVARRTGIRHYSGLAFEVARDMKTHVLHSHFGPTGWQNLKLAARMDLKHVVTFYGLDVNFLPRQGWHSRYEALFDQVDLVLCEGPHMAGCIVKLGCAAEKVRLHRLGVDLDRIEFKPRRWNGDEPLRFLIAASFREKKGIPYAIEALGRVGERCPVELTVIGDASASREGQQEKKRIFEALSNAKLSNVRLLGYQPHEMLLREAQHHHAFISPSVTARNGDTEGGAPVCIIELLAGGMNVISTRHCDIPEIITHGETGWLAEERDVEGLVDCIEQMIESRENWRAMLERGRAHLAQRFNSKEQGRRLGSTYRELADD